MDSPEVVGNLAGAANFARFLLPSLFPGLSRALFLDVDTVVLGDIAEVWKLLASTDMMMVAVPRYHNTCTYQVSQHMYIPGITTHVHIHTRILTKEVQHPLYILAFSFDVVHV